MTAGSVILAVPTGWELGSEIFVAAYLVHLIRGSPLIVYEMDEWRASLNPASGIVARLLERLFHSRILKSASTVWVISQPLAEKLHHRFGVDAKVLASTVDLGRYAFGRRGGRAHKDEFRVLFTGAIYGAQVGALRNLLRAIQVYPYEAISLCIYTPQSPKELAALGLSGPRLCVQRAVPLEQMPEILCAADALALPFSFDEDQREIVTTSFPSKTAEYLASGVPVLVHAPAYSSIARLARQEGWAEVVDEPSEERLVGALRRLATDNAYRRKLADNALNAAQTRHNLARCRAEFYDSLR